MDYFETDKTVDAKGMFMAAAAAGPVYKLLGKKDLGTTEFPPAETSLTDGSCIPPAHQRAYAGTQLANFFRLCGEVF
ncbi:MAG: hypothetical protein NVSMB7_09430 [Chitinophagaceae bacterium]